jgi:hypothetical protein
VTAAQCPVCWARMDFCRLAPNSPPTVTATAQEIAKCLYSSFSDCPVVRNIHEIAGRSAS